MKKEQDLCHGLNNTFSLILMGLDSVERKIKQNDISGALETIRLIKEKSPAAKILLKNIQQFLEKK